MSMLMLRCGKPGILSKLGRASCYPNEPLAALLETFLSPGIMDLDPSVAPVGLPCPWHLATTCSSGLILAALIHLCVGDWLQALICLMSSVLTLWLVEFPVAQTRTSEKGQDLLSQAFSWSSGSPILLPSAQFAPPPGSLTTLAHSDLPVLSREVQSSQMILLEVSMFVMYVKGLGGT